MLELMMTDLNNLMDAAKDVIDSEDNTGCSEDLTVVSKKAVDNLQSIIDRISSKEHRRNTEELACGCTVTKGYRCPVHSAP